MTSKLPPPPKTVLNSPPCTGITIAGGPTDSFDIAKRIHTIVGGSFEHVQEQLAAGRTLIEGELFTFDDFDRTVRRLLSLLAECSVGTSATLGRRPVSPAAILSMLPEE